MPTGAIKTTMGIQNEKMNFMPDPDEEFFNSMGKKVKYHLISG